MVPRQRELVWFGRAAPCSAPEATPCQKAACNLASHTEETDGASLGHLNSLSTSNLFQPTSTVSAFPNWFPVKILVAPPSALMPLASISQAWQHTVVAGARPWCSPNKSPTNRTTCELIGGKKLQKFKVLGTFRESTKCDLQQF